MRKPPALPSRVLAAIPDLVPAAMAGFAVGLTFLLDLGHFEMTAAIPLGVACAVIACLLAGLPAAPERRRELWATVAALLIALLWLLYNIRYSAQDVYNTRDPANYTITARWLVDHPSLQIQTHPDVFGNPAGGQIFTGSYAQVSPTVINSQGEHLLPAFVAVGGSLFGTAGLLKANVIITALALVSFFGLARRVVGDRLSLVVLTALAVSMPVIYVGRDTYTEPLLLLYLMGALLFVHRGWQSGRWQDWALAGLASGAATGVRVDSYGALLGIVAGITVFAGIAATAEARRRAAWCTLALAAGAVGPFVLGWIDLTHLSRQYFHAQHGNIIHLVYLLLAAALVSPAVVWLLWRTRLRAALASPAVARRAPRVVAVLLAVTFVALVTRPAWQTTRGKFVADLENMQRRWGVAVDGTRTYNEQTLHWQALYYGWVTIALAFAGYGVLFAQLMRRRAYPLTAVLGMGVPLSMLYLVTSEVAPDQPWAMRRYVPVIIPLFLVAAAAALRAMWRWGSARQVVVRPFVVAAVAVMIAFPTAVSWPMRHVREENGQLTQLQAICRAVGKDGAIVETDDATAFGYGQSVRSFCGVPAIAVPQASGEELAQIGVAVRAHGRVPYVLGQSPEFTGGRPGQAFSVVNVQRWPTQINKAPEEADAQQYAVWLSRVDASGQLVPIPPLTLGK